MDNAFRISELRKKISTRNTPQQLREPIKHDIPKPFKKPITHGISPQPSLLQEIPASQQRPVVQKASQITPKADQISTSAQDSASVNIYVLYSVANSSQCWNKTLFDQDTPKILKALHMDKSEINFDELGWYFMSKYPDLYRFGKELENEKDLDKASADLLRIKAHRIAQKIDFSEIITIPEDVDFRQKALERHQFFLDFLDKGNPEEMPFDQMIKITGSMDYMELEYADSDKKNKFTNMGYKMLGDFMAGKLDIKPKNVGEAYLFFKQILKDTTRKASYLPFTAKDVLHDCIITQLENVRNGRYPTTIENFSRYSAGLAQANKAFNERYYQTVERRRQHQKELSQIMKEHTFIDSQKHCRKDSIYYGALYDKISLKYDSVINKYECGVKKYAGLYTKVLRILNTVIDRKEQLEQNSKNTQQSNFSLSL